MNYFSAAGTALGTKRERRWQKLLLHARPEHNKPYAGYQESDRDRCRDLHGFFFVHGCFDGAEFRYFFLLVIVEIGVNESNHTKNQQDNSENDDETLHGSEPITTAALCVSNADRRTSAPVRRRGVLIELQKLTNGWRRLLLLRLSWRPWLRWRLYGDAWSSAESRALHRSIRPS